MLLQDVQWRRHRPSSAWFFKNRLQSVGTLHCSRGTSASTKLTRLRALYVGSATPWLMASMRQRPTETCLFFFCALKMCDGTAGAALRICWYTARARLLSPFLNAQLSVSLDDDEDEDEDEDEYACACTIGRLSGEVREIPAAGLIILEATAVVGVRGSCGGRRQSEGPFNTVPPLRP